MILLGRRSFAAPSDFDHRGARLPKRPRKSPIWLRPDGIELEYRRYLLGIVKTIGALLTRYLTPMLPSLVIEAQANLPTLDAAHRDDLPQYPKRVHDIIERLKRELAESQRRQPVNVLEDLGRRISDFNKRQSERVIRGSLGMSVLTAEPWLAETIDAFVHEGSSLITSLESDTVAKVERLIIRELANGQNAMKLARAMREELDVSRNRAALIARDQTLKLNGRLAELRQTEMGISEYRWRCLAPDTKVAAFGVSAVARRPQVGHMLRLTMRSGRELTITPDHKVLTRRGWVAACRVDQGDDLVSYLPEVEKAIVTSASSLALSPQPRLATTPAMPDVDHMPTEIAQVFIAAHDTRSAGRVVGSVVDLDVEGGNSDVEVILVDGHLANRMEPSIPERVRQLALECSDLDLAALLSDGSVQECFTRLADTDSLGSPLCGSCGGLLGSLASEGIQAGIVETTDLSTGGDDDRGDFWPAASVSSRENQDRIAGAVFANQLLGEPVDVGPRLDRSGRWPSRLASERESSNDGRDAAPMSFPQDGERSPLAVLFGYDRCESVDVVASTGSHVYDLSTANEWLVANTFVVHNSTHDNRVRPLHAARDGKIFEWSKPPSDGHPGQPINCRCIPLPVLDGILAKARGEA